MAFRILLFSLLFNYVTAYAQNNSEGIAVVELFTSQGDINCVEADKILTELNDYALKNNLPVHVISEHVDFWNRYGWKDPFSSIMYTRRLQNYAAVFKEKEIFTPKLLINGQPYSGKIEFASVLKVVKEQIGKQQLYPLTASFTINADTLDLNYKLNKKLPIGKSGSNYYISIVIVKKHNTTKVTKGDNAGKTLTNTNVSKTFYTSTLKNSEGVIRIPMKGKTPGPEYSIIVFIQDKQNKKIVGSIKI